MTMYSKLKAFINKAKVENCQKNNRTETIVKQRSVRYWKRIVHDVRRYCRGEIKREELDKRYPKLRVRKDYNPSLVMDDSIDITIPSNCPLRYVYKIVETAQERDGDKAIVYEVYAEFISCRQWRDLMPMDTWFNELCRITTKPQKVTFKCILYNDILNLYYHLEYGDNGDDDGYGVEPDTWLRANINSKGTFIKPFFIER